MPAPSIIAQLVQRFEDNRASYHAAGYNETQLRREFLDPFYKALGWDVDNEQGHAEAYKDVIHEDAIKVGGASKAPDYCFRIGGRRIFFLEAKKPAVNIKDDVSPAFQLRRYAWSAKLPLSILSDFDELAVYDCRIKPDKGDKPSVGRIMYMTCREYVERWDELADIFSREAVLKGSFDRFAEGTKLKRGTAQVDTAFLEEIESWRSLLAKNLATRNAKLGQRDLNFAVQRTIDRIIFLRMCEDRGIEPYGQLQGLTNGERIYKRLAELFEQADDRYNSGLFHFHAEKGRSEPPDELTLSLALDDKPLKEIIRGLYYPESPYEFSVLPAEILGQVYEQFLGKVIRLTAGHQAKVEDKPEVKKAGGVYYTPAYIVDYIVKNTVGKLVEDKTPKEVAKLRILDPACGSGSFLVGALEFLLTWHRDWYLNDGPSKHRKEIYQGRGGQWFLTTAEKKRILLANIYGVDIDSQAVEVTKLSLLLKVLEHESSETLERQRRFAHERALPDLGNNIKCGNSLIGPDFYNGRQLMLLDEEERYRVNAFDWKTEFPQIFKGKDAGFDAVIGNPPYIRIQALTQAKPLEVEYYKRCFVAASKGNYDIYVVFIEKGFGLLRTAGRLGFIIPSKFLTTDYGEPIRTLIDEAASLSRIVDFGHELVFSGVSTYTILLFLSRAKNKSTDYVAVHPADLVTESNGGQSVPAIMVSEMGSGPWVFQSPQAKTLLRKLTERHTPLLDLPALMSRGSSTGADPVFILREEGGHLYDRTGHRVSVEAEILRRPLYATDFGRYSFHPASNDRLIFPYFVERDGYEALSESQFKQRFPRALEYLRSKRRLLDSRKQFNQWFGFSAPRNLSLHDRATIVVPLLANQGMFAPLPDNREHYCLMASGGFSITLDFSSTLTELILAILNSKLLFWYLERISNRFRGGWITCTKQYVGRIPIVRLNESDLSQRRRVDEIVDLVRQLLELKRSLRRPRNADAQTKTQRLVSTAERRIDDLVYQLYELSDKEVAIVEATSEA